jgi:hypothetical protein
LSVSIRQQMLLSVSIRQQMLIPQHLRRRHHLGLEGTRGPLEQPLLRRQYLYFCTSKASELSTWSSRFLGVSICTFVLVKQVN